MDFAVTTLNDRHLAAAGLSGQKTRPSRLFAR
jgi:hypothetical protein